MLKRIFFATVFGLFAINCQADVDRNYQLGPGDTIRVVVYGEEDMSMDVLLSNSGLIDFPYLGDIQVGGKTIEELKNLLVKGLKGDYLIDPKIMVSILSFRQIYVNGEVKRPGGYPYQPGLTVDKAIALAGGFTERAKRDGIAITPTGNLPEIKDVSLKHRINPGDIIVVRQTFF